jgi:hypothetical protein
MKKVLGMAAAMGVMVLLAGRQPAWALSSETASHRRYRRVDPWEEAVAEILRCGGSHFDPRVGFSDSGRRAALPAARFGQAITLGQTKGASIERPRPPR